MYTLDVPYGWIWLLHCVLVWKQLEAWKQCNYSSSTTDKWRVTWEIEHGPGSRRGHSLVLFNESSLILFGGRGEDLYRTHIPRIYDREYANDTWTFKSYHDKPLMPKFNATKCRPTPVCFPLHNSTPYNASNLYCSMSWDRLVFDNMTFEQVEQKEEECGFVTTGVFFNDVWMYDSDCYRDKDTECTDHSWRIIHHGSRLGCSNEKGSTMCISPSERWHHGAALIDNHTMAIYGGFGPECEDYCEDLWFFDFMEVQWIKYEIKGDENKRPNKRWKFSMVSGRNAKGANIALVFGGHRLWHGFSTDNAESNKWSNVDIIPRGGYLDDLWILQGNPSDRSSSSQIWNQITGSEDCRAASVDWILRNQDYDCNVAWPTARASHAAVFDYERVGMWLHGGYTSFYPYPSTTSSGSGYGVKSLLGNGVKPFSSFSYFLDDLWFFDIRTRKWIQIKSGSKRPSRRMGHVLVHSHNLLILHGGYADNFYYGDTWYFYIQNKAWLEKQEFSHADFPSDCFDDLAVIDRDKGCILLDYPIQLLRANESSYPFQYQQILPYEYQPGYTPKRDNPVYFGIVNNATALVEKLTAQFLDKIVLDSNGQRIWVQSNISDGTPIAPNAATGPRQYARQILYNFTDNITLNIWEWCTSVKGEPTRNRLTDGLFGRSNVSIFIPQLRRLSPGWDGCRDLNWLYPPSRYEHRGIFVPKHQSVIIYGGLGYAMNQRQDAHPKIQPSDKTLKVSVLNDMWVLHMDICLNNCSGQGTCLNGSCKCNVGFYGIDCSNITCPGSVCYYDEYYSQQCTHCCYDGFTHHLDGSDSYKSGVRKVPCVPLALDVRGIFTGNSNGICDGFGSCQCAPPFVGDDCSILNCKHSCSFNGYCSFEFPVSRCLCSDGYFGEYCQHKSCLNNCSYPNGQCDYNTGLCLCLSINSFHNHYQQSTRWQGEDCSYLSIWSAAYDPKGASWLLLTISILISLLI